MTERQTPPQQLHEIRPETRKINLAAKLVLVGTTLATAAGIGLITQGGEQEKALGVEIVRNAAILSTIPLGYLGSEKILDLALREEILEPRQD